MRKYKILATLAMIVSLLLLALISSKTKQGNQ